MNSEPWVRNCLSQYVLSILNPYQQPCWSLYDKGGRREIKEDCNYTSLQSTKAVYNRILDLKIATPQIVLNFGSFLEANNYFEEAFKSYERGVALFKWPQVQEIWKTYLGKFISRYVSVVIRVSGMAD